jgi:hypothetical protein
MTSQIDITLPVMGTPTTQSVRDNFTTAANEISTLQNQTTGSPFLSLQGGRMDGPMYLFNDPTDAMQPATKGYVDAGGDGGGGGIPEAPSVAGDTFGRSQGAWVLVAALSGATMTGPFTLHADPANALDAVTKQYADAIAAEIVAPAPSDGFFYARQNNAWAKVLGLTGGQLSGALGVGVVTLPANVNASSVVTSVHASAAFGVNAYLDNGTTTAWRYLTAGAASLLNNSGNGLSLAGAATGAAGAAITWGPAVNIDYKGNVMLGSAPAIPNDVLNPTLSSTEHAVGPTGHFSFNAYLATGPAWKYLTTSYAGVFYQSSTDGSINISIANSGSANGAIALNPSFRFDTSGGFTAPGGVNAGGTMSSDGYYCGSGGQFFMGFSGSNPIINFAANNYIVYVPSSGIQYATTNGHSFGGPITANNGITVVSQATIAGQIFPDNNNGRSCGNTTGQGWFQCAAANFPNTSDPRLKENIAPAPPGALDRVRAIPVHTFNYREGITRAQHTGFDATEVLAHHPNAIMPREDEDEMLAVNLPDMIALLWQAVQELSEK